MGTQQVKLGGAVLLGVNRANGATLPPVPQAPQAPAQTETASEKLARLQAEMAALQAAVETEKAAEIETLQAAQAEINARLAKLQPAPQPQPAVAPMAARQPNRVYPGFANQKAAIRWHYAQAGPAGLTLAQLSEKLGLPKGDTRSNYSKALVASGHLVRLSSNTFAHTASCLPMPS